MLLEPTFRSHHLKLEVLNVKGASKAPFETGDIEHTKMTDTVRHKDAERIRLTILIV